MRTGQDPLGAARYTDTRVFYTLELLAFRAVILRMSPLSHLAIAHDQLREQLFALYRFVYETVLCCEIRAMPEGQLYVTPLDDDWLLLERVDGVIQSIPHLIMERFDHWQKDNAMIFVGDAMLRRAVCEVEISLLHARVQEFARLFVIVHRQFDDVAHNCDHRSHEEYTTDTQCALVDQFADLLQQYGDRLRCYSSALSYIQIEPS